MQIMQVVELIKKVQLEPINFKETSLYIVLAKSNIQFQLLKLNTLQLEVIVLKYYGWVINYLIMNLNLKRFLFFYDNTSTITITEIPVKHSRTKHIEKRYYFIREHVINGTVELYFIPIEKRLGDIFTKPLDETTFIRLVIELGMLNFS